MFWFSIYRVQCVCFGNITFFYPMKIKIKKILTLLGKWVFWVWVWFYPKPIYFFGFFGWVWPGFLGWPNPWTPLEAGTDARDAYREFCSLPKCFCSLPSEMTKMPLRDLPHAACCDKPRQNLISNLKSLSNYPTPKFLQLQIKQHSNNKNK